jgi:hypothetical protein
MTPITKDATNSGMNMVVDLLCIHSTIRKPTFIAGLLGFLIVECMQSKSTTMFIPEFVASFVIGVKTPGTIGIIEAIKDGPIV